MKRDFDVFAALAALPPGGATPPLLPPISAIPSAAAALPWSLHHATEPVGALAAALAEAAAAEAAAAVAAVEACAMACSEAFPHFAGSLFLYFFAYELAYYYWHRALHEVPVLYR